MTTETYTIPEGNLFKLKGEFDRLAKRAIRLGLTPPTYTVGDRVETIHKNTVEGGLDETRVEVTYPVTLTSDVVKLAGWTFLGTLDHTEEATIVRAVPGVSLPVSYRTATPKCEHCKAARKRNDTFVLLHDDGTFKQVGRQCLADFLGTDPTKAAKNAEYLALFGELLGSGEDEGFGGGAGSKYSVLVEFLGWVALSIRTGGWVSRKAARESDGRKFATADSIDFLIEEARKHKGDRPSDDDAALALAALAWVRDVKDSATGDLSDYLYNLTTVCASEVVSRKNEGIAASVIPSYQRASGKEREKKFEAAVSNFFGTEKKRAEYTLTLVHAASFESDYGVRWMLKFRDEAGNVAVWWTGQDGAYSLTGYENGGQGRSVEDSKGRTYLVKATVKGHEDYKGVKQTGLSRVVVLADMTDASLSLTSSLT